MAVLWKKSETLGYRPRLGGWLAGRVFSLKKQFIQILLQLQTHMP